MVIANLHGWLCCRKDMGRHITLAVVLGTLACCETFQSIVDFRLPDESGEHRALSRTAAGALPVVEGFGLAPGGWVSGVARLLPRTDGSLPAGVSAVVKMMSEDDWQRIESDILLWDVRANCNMPSLRAAPLSNLSNSFVNVTHWPSWRDNVTLFPYANVATVDPGPMEATWFWSVPTYGRYVVVLQLCQNISGVTVEVQVRMVNPGNVESDFELVPLVDVFVGAGIAHIVLFFAWVFVLVNGKASRPKLLWFFAVLMLLKALVASITTAQLLLFQKVSEPNSTFRFVVEAVTFVAEFGLLGGVLLLASGYTITRSTLKAREYQLIVATLVVHFVFKTIGTLCSLARLKAGTCNSLLLSESITFFVALLLACGLFNHHVELLMRRLKRFRSLEQCIRPDDQDVDASAVEPNDDVDSDVSPTQYTSAHTLLLLRDFRWPFYTYAMIPAFTMVVRYSLLGQGQLYVAEVLDQFSSVFLFMIVIYHFSSLTSAERLVEPE